MRIQAFSGRSLCSRAERSRSVAIPWANLLRADAGLHDRLIDNNDWLPTASVATSPTSIIQFHLDGRGATTATIRTGQQSLWAGEKGAPAELDRTLGVSIGLRAGKAIAGRMRGLCTGSDTGCSLSHTGRMRREDVV